MINSEKFYKLLIDEGINFFTGVPDSHLNNFCNYLNDNLSCEENIIAANEGNAVAIAAGHYFATGKIPCVYMQNSGLGNAINPLLSLADKNVFNVPILLLIGWRGEPNSNDHAQHISQGKLTPKFLELMDIPYIVATNDFNKLEDDTKSLIDRARKEKKQVAIIAGKGVFSEKDKKNRISDNYPLSREEAIEIVLEQMPKDTIFVATTGRATRELYFLREKRHEDHAHDFLNVGAMGHASSVALGIAITDKNRPVVCLDGDAAAIMHMGAMTMASTQDIPNFFHIILNNGVHESVGGQPSAGQKINFTEIASGAGYQTIEGPVSEKKDIIDAINRLNNDRKSAAFLDIHIHTGLKADLPPLKVSHHQIIDDLMHTLIKEGN